MNRLLSAVMIALCLALLWSVVQARGKSEIREIVGLVKQGPRAVLTIYYMPNKDGKGPPMVEGEFYVLKVLKTGLANQAGKPPYFVDYGFCKLEIEK